MADLTGWVDMYAVSQHACWCLIAKISSASTTGEADMPMGAVKACGHYAPADRLGSCSGDAAVSKLAANEAACWFMTQAVGARSVFHRGLPSAPPSCTPCEAPPCMPLY